jgi:hypothetical protein
VGLHFGRVRAGVWAELLPPVLVPSETRYFNFQICNSGRALEPDQVKEQGDEDISCGLLPNFVVESKGEEHSS